MMDHRGVPANKFVLVTANATIEQVIKAVVTPFFLRLEVVNRKLTACVCFAYTAELTSEISALANLFADGSLDRHTGCSESC
jgi:hypothetical protein